MVRTPVEDSLKSQHTHDPYAFHRELDIYQAAYEGVGHTSMGQAHTWSMADKSAYHHGRSDGKMRKKP